jgi:serine/threonine protein kinase
VKNILVLQPGPEWWVKIGDFGISKRAEEESTALRTLIGTKGYLAPEIIGLFAPDDPSGTDSGSPSYTFAVDIWALGEITFRMITKHAAFPHPRDLFNYVVSGRPFPTEQLLKYNAGEDCCDFIVKTMAPCPSKRPSANEAATHAWVQVSRPPSRSGSNHSDQ